MANKRLFEQTLISDPGYNDGYESYRFAIGKAGTSTLNFTLTAMKTWLSNKLGLTFMTRSMNLNDVADKATARTNLAVYSTSQTYTNTEIDNAINLAKTILRSEQAVTVGYYGYVNGIETCVMTKIGGNRYPTGSRTALGKYTITHNIGSKDYSVTLMIQHELPIGADDTIDNVTHKITKTINTVSLEFKNEVDFNYYDKCFYIKIEEW